MDRLGVQDKTTKKRASPAKRKNPAVKVVYIGDPKKVQANAADFSALVQELTGWNAASVSMRLKPADLPESPKSHVHAQDPGVLLDQLSPPDLQTSPDHDQSSPMEYYSDFSIESFDEWILQQMLDGLS